MVGIGKTALVTGASSGLGTAFAEQLATQHYDLIVVARRADRLQELAARLAETDHVSVEPLVADLTDPEQLESVAERIGQATGLSMLVNNAGVAFRRPFSELDPKKAEGIIRLKVVALTRLTRAALPGMLRRHEGTIINVSSVAAFAPRPFMITYGGANAYVSAFTEGLAQEVQGTGVRVQVLCPGFMRTEAFDVAEWDVSAVPESYFQPPAAVAAASLRALELGEVVCLPNVEDSRLLDEVSHGKQRIAELLRSGDAIARRYAPPAHT